MPGITTSPQLRESPDTRKREAPLADCCALAGCTARDRPKTTATTDNPLRIFIIFNLCLSEGCYQNVIRRRSAGTKFRFSLMILDCRLWRCFTDARTKVSTLMLRAL